MLDHQASDGTDRIALILAKDMWCRELLGALAEHGCCSRAELLCARGPGDAPPGAQEGLDRRLSLLQSARLIEIANEGVTITEFGSAAAARLNSLFAGGRTPLPGAALPQSVPEAEPVSGDAVEPPSARRSNLSFWKSGPGDANDLPRDAPQNPTAATFVLVAALLVVLGWNYLGTTAASGDAGYRFASVARADLSVSTIATGQIRAIDAVEVSSQLSGQVVELSANFNDEVAAGAPLARLDDKIFRATVAEAQARQAHAKASHESAMATTAGAKARHDEAREDFERKQALANKGSVSAQEVDKARANLLAAESEWNAARADGAVQEASIAIAEAALQKAEIDLERTVIRSPIDGVIIGRSVELGQTVAASVEAPTLFTIAQRLSEMRVHARVDEADIGQIRVGQNARFSVDAYPGRFFSGKVVEVHRAPEIVQNVVTYTVVITARNPELALLPGMTALISIVTTERSDALLVPNAALRFDPGTADAPEQEKAAEAQRAHAWVRTGPSGLSRVEVGVGASDGSVTEVVSGALTEGQQVAIGNQTAESSRTLFGLRLGF